MSYRPRCHAGALHDIASYRGAAGFLCWHCWALRGESPPKRPDHAARAITRLQVVLSPGEFDVLFANRWRSYPSRTK